MTGNIQSTKMEHFRVQYSTAPLKKQMYMRKREADSCTALNTEPSPIIPQYVEECAQTAETAKIHADIWL